MQAEHEPAAVGDEPLQVGPYVDLGFFKHPIGSMREMALAFEGFLEHLAHVELLDLGRVGAQEEAASLQSELAELDRRAVAADRVDARRLLVGVDRDEAVEIGLALMVVVGIALALDLLADLAEALRAARD